MKFAKPLEGFQGDVDALSDIDVKRMALMLLRSLRDGKVTGEPLERRAGTADLSDCFKAYFEPIGGIKPRFRVVYRIVSASGEPALQPVSVGLREDLDAYLGAARNLGRI